MLTLCKGSCIWLVFNKFLWSGNDSYQPVTKAYSLSIIYFLSIQRVMAPICISIAINIHDSL